MVVLHWFTRPKSTVGVQKVQKIIRTQRGSHPLVFTFLTVNSNDDMVLRVPKYCCENYDVFFVLLKLDLYLALHVFTCGHMNCD